MKIYWRTKSIPELSSLNGRQRTFIGENGHSICPNGVTILALVAVMPPIVQFGSALGGLMSHGSLGGKVLGAMVAIPIGMFIVAQVVISLARPRLREFIERERIVIRNHRVGRQTKLLTRKELDLLEPGCIRRRCGSDPSRAHTSGKQAWMPSWCKPRRSPSP